MIIKPKTTCKRSEYLSRTNFYTVTFSSNILKKVGAKIRTKKVL